MVTTKRREYKSGHDTNDVYVDGQLYVSAVGDSILEEILSRITTRREHTIKYANRS